MMRYSSTHVANIEATFRDQMRKVFLNDDDTAYYFYGRAREAQLE